MTAGDQLQSAWLVDRFSLIFNAKIKNMVNIAREKVKKLKEITLLDCIKKYEEAGETVILNDGTVLGFEKNK